MSTMNIFDMTDTWNASGTTFAGIKLNVTDTASASGSLLMDLQVGGSTQFSVGKAGVLRTGLTIRPTAQTNIGIIFGNGFLAVERADIATNNFSVSATSRAVKLGATAFFGWSGTTDSSTSTADLTLYRDAAGTLAQRNGTNAQAFRLYNTFTDASNYERGFMRWASNVLEIGAEAAGTGTVRVLKFMHGSTKVFETSEYGGAMFTSGGVRVGFWHNTPGLHLEKPLIMTEQATAPTAIANQARLFAEDDGAGKTRLMVQFGTGAAQQIAIEP